MGLSKKAGAVDLYMLLHNSYSGVVEWSKKWGWGGGRLGVGMNGGVGVFDKEYQSVPINCKASRLSAFVQVTPKCLPFAQDTTKQCYLSRKATMGIFGLYEQSHIKRY